MDSIELYNKNFMILDSAYKSVFVRATDSWVLNLLSLPKTVEMCEIRMHLKMDLNPLWFLLIIVGFCFHATFNNLSDSDGIVVRPHVYEESLFIAISRRKEKRWHFERSGNVVFWWWIFLRHQSFLQRISSRYILL